MKVLSILILAIGYASGQCISTQSNCVSFPGPSDVVVNELQVPVGWGNAITPMDCCLSCKQSIPAATSFGLYHLLTLNVNVAPTNINDYQVCRCYTTVPTTHAPGKCIAGYGIGSVDVTPSTVITSKQSVNVAPSTIITSNQSVNYITGAPFANAIGTVQLYTIHSI